MPPISFAPSRYSALSWPLLVGALVYLGFLGYGGMMLGDGDTYWHIASGKWILDHGAIPDRDPFSHSMPGAPWTAHEWLSEVVMALARQSFGWAGLIALAAASFAGTIAMLTRFLLKSFEPVHALIFAAIAVAMTVPHLHVRPHVLAMPLLVLWCAHLVRAADEGRAPSLWLLPAMTLWANLHGGFTLGLALTLFFAAESVLQARRQGGAVVAAKSWGRFSALALASSLITPHGVGGILFTLQILGGSFALDHISEWQSPNFHGFQPLELWLLAGLALALHQGVRLPAFRLLLLLGLLHLALKHMRNVELLGLLLPLFLATSLAEQWRERSATAKHVAGVDRIFAELAGPASRKAIAGMLAALALFTLLFMGADNVRPKEGAVPARAVEAVRQAGITGPVLNEYGFGGYLIYEGIPTFIDGRADMYGDAFMKEYFGAISLSTPDSLQAVLEKYHIAWTLLPPDFAAVAMLDILPGWQRLYADEQAVVHVRQVSVDER